jgi:hypothetical protein
MAKRKVEGWDNYKTVGFHGFHTTGEDAKCTIKYPLFTCNHPYHEGRNGR